MGYMGCVKVWSVNGGFRVFVKSGLAKKIFIQKDLEIWNICSIFAVEKRGKKSNWLIYKGNHFLNNISSHYNLLMMGLSPLWVRANYNI